MPSPPTSRPRSTPPPKVRKTNRVTQLRFTATGSGARYCSGCLRCGRATCGGPSRTRLAEILGAYPPHSIPADDKAQPAALGERRHPKVPGCPQPSTLIGVSTCVVTQQALPLSDCLLIGGSIKGGDIHAFRRQASLDRPQPTAAPHGRWQPGQLSLLDGIWCLGAFAGACRSRAQAGGIGDTFWPRLSAGSDRRQHYRFSGTREPGRRGTDSGCVTPVVRFYGRRYGP